MPYGDRTVIARTGWEQGHVLWGLLETRLDIAVMVGDEDKLLSPCSCLPSSRLPVPLHSATPLVTFPAASTNYTAW